MTKMAASLVALLICATAAGHSQAPVPPPPPQDQSYTPRFKPGVPILSQVKPDEKVVEVLVDARPHYAMEPDAGKEIDGLTKMAAAVAVVRVVDKRSAFTTLNAPPYHAPGDWINSTVAAQVQTVLKDSTGKLTEGGTVSFSENGGEVSVDGRRVIARNSYEVPTRVGLTYLVFFWLNKGELQNIGPSWTFHIDGQKLHRLRTDIDPKWQLERQTFEWTESRIRANARQQEAGRE